MGQLGKIQRSTRQPIGLNGLFDPNNHSTRWWLRKHVHLRSLRNSDTSCKSRDKCSTFQSLQSYL
ncbi:hypothetical protein phiMH2Kp03 [Bdellovibrio phage phiMH2K]|uniref:Uncharacterized protein Z n=1 Tax=Bdellovibrio phage phiMH2K TaxID=145579 RepID=Z_BPPHM|nr:hypothetical protein phiMH2Kp03 [Bdellovibrio phage phiMH2K]Q9G058.1 RecName: Full=Uncharacterized protein Z [Bdellovibrio phage phiMH2K]AAG45341.1 OrfZ [Bdellovibrio phage phiMH2K]